MRSAFRWGLTSLLTGLIPGRRQPNVASSCPESWEAPEPGYGIAEQELETASSARRSAIDESQRLVSERVVYLRGEITSDLASEVIAKLLFLEAEDPLRPVTLEIDSPGGAVTAGLAIYGTMQRLNCRVRTRCTGQAACIAAVLLAAGTRGDRTALPACRVLIPQTPFDDLATTAGLSPEQRDQLPRMTAKLEKILARHTGQSLDRVRIQSRDASWMDPGQAKAFGLIDEVSSLA